MKTPETNPAPSRAQRLLVTGLAAGGAGLARHGGLAVLIPGALPEEEILAQVGPPQGSWARGRLLEVLRPSPLRIEPDCPWAGRCGGCDLWAIDPAAAWPLKARAALGPLAEARQIPLTLGPVSAGHSYRTRAVFHLGPGDSKTLAVGFHPLGERTVIGLADCRLLRPGLAAGLPVLNAWAASLPWGLEADLSFTLGLGPGEGLMGLITPAGAEARKIGPRLDLEPLEAQLAETTAAPARLFLARPGQPPTPVSPGRGPAWVTAAAWPEWGLIPIPRQVCYNDS